MTIETNGWVRRVTLTPPSLRDNTADAERLVGALQRQLGADRVEIDFELLKPLPRLLRTYSWDLRCALFRHRGHWHVLGLAGAVAGTLAGLAVDLGTTRVVLRLVDLASGRVAAETAFDNPQLAVGPDILARIHHADRPGGLSALQGLIVEGLNRALAGLCRSGGIAPEEVCLAAVAGNTAMTHLFLGLDPRWMIREPYIPVVNRPGLMRAATLGLALGPGARVFVFPNVGSYFGGDLLAGILYSGLQRAEQTAILVDVGTNAEVVLGNRHWLIACAGAAGPALEGGVTQMGMMAGPGVIDRVQIDPSSGRIDVHTIDARPPVGICGSGLIDLAAQLFLAGLIDIRGRFDAARCGDRLRTVDGVEQFVLVPANVAGTGGDLVISQIDLDSLIRSKAAMYTILETLAASVGVQLADLAAFYVGGTFGAFIRPESAVTIGMLPDLPLERYAPLGNTSLGGATQVLQDPQAPETIDRIRDRVTYLELNVNQDFMNRFSAAKFIPHTNRGLFPSVRRGA